MAQVTIIGDETKTVDATIDIGRILVARDALPGAVGWELKAEGLCRADTCVPVPEPSALLVGDRLDLGAVADALGRPSVIDAGAGIAAIGLDAEQRRRALRSLVAPPFTLADLDGNLHELSEWRGRKRLLHAFSSW
jgi:hypothetical protein